MFKLLRNHSSWLFRGALNFLLVIPLLLAACGSETPTAVSSQPTATVPPPATSIPTAAPTATVQLEPTATPTPKPDFSEVDTYVTELMKTYDVPGLGLALIKDGKIIYTKGYGMRNTQTKTPVTENTVFAIGSVSKSFTALGVLQLVSEGKIDLDAPVIKYLPDFKLSDAEATQKLTVRQILSHSSGLPRSDDWYSDQTSTRQQIVADMSKITLTAQPGKLWQYCNQNFVLAGYLIEKITGQTWEEYTKQHIFNPLGMSSANFEVSQVQQLPDFAAPHALDVLKGMQPIPFFKGLGPIGPAGSINANVEDMAKYTLFQLGDGTIEGKRLLPQALLDEMHRPQIVLPSTPEADLISGKPVTSNGGYGFGWITEDFRGYKVVQHSGNIDGFSANVALVPSARDGVVILTNANGADLFMNVLNLHTIEWLLGLKSEQNLSDVMSKYMKADPAELQAKLVAARIYKADPADLQRLVGDYDGVLGQFSLALQDSKLHLLINGKTKQNIELVPFKAGYFLANSWPLNGAEISFKLDASGKVTVYMAGTEVGQTLNKDAKTTEYKDPKGRFTATIPDGLVMQQQGDLVALQAKNPDGLFILTATEAGNDDLKTTIKKLVKANYDPSFEQEPIDTRPIPLPSGLTWTQFLYQLPSDQLLAVVAIKQGGTAYFVVGQAKQSDITAITPKFNSLLLSFKITG